jgi:uncharacterized protein involved in high-affinity Fe2+ transport
MPHRRVGIWTCVFVLGLTLTWVVAAQQMGEHSHGMETASSDQPQAPIRITMEELHQHGGVPPGWKFAFPDGDPASGRAVFTKLECYQCHAVQGESFPQTSAQAGNTGPNLTGMGSHHPAEYFAETIVNPNAVIVTGPGYTDAHGMSIMPDYRGSLTVGELIDLVAYLKSLQGEHAHSSAMASMQHAGQDALVDKVVGDYHIRLVYHEGMTGGPEHSMQGMQSQGSQGHDGHAGSMAQAPSQNHLMAFITDANTGAPVPYLPVTATIATTKRSSRKVKLEPMMGGQGFHYGADVTLPSQAAKVTLSIGATTMRVMPSAAGSFAKPQRVSLDWTPQQPASTGMSGHTPGQQRHDMPSGTMGH